MRLFHQAYAFLFGYFWLRCPFPGCNRYFGGHERSDYSIPDPDQPGLYRMTCSKHNHLWKAQYDESMARAWGMLTIREKD